MDKEKEIKKYMTKLNLTREEAEELWNVDNGIEENEEQEALDKKAKAVKIDMGATKGEKKEQKPRKVNTSNEKQALFTGILGFLQENYENVTVTRENKLIFVKIGEKSFDINFVEKRPPKK